MLLCARKLYIGVMKVLLGVRKVLLGVRKVSGRFIRCQEGVNRCN